MSLDIAGFAILATLLTIAPGQDTLLVLRNATLGGFAGGLGTTAGVASGLFLHATLSAVGVSAIVATSAEVFAALKLLGTAYLVWLGLQSFLRLRARRDDGAHRDVGTAVVHPGAAARQGFLSNVLNPKTATFYLALLPQFVEPEHALFQSLTLGAVHFVITLAWLGTLSLFVEWGREILSRPRVQQTVDSLADAAFLLFGVRLALAKP